MILVKTFYAYNDLRNFSYLIYDDQKGEAWVIDPYEAGPMIEYIKKNSLELKGILNTHQHFDHVRGNAPLQEAFGSPVQRLRNSQTVFLSQEQWIETLDTPGHTMDHKVFLWKSSGAVRALFSGDTLFNSGVGNCKNGGDVPTLYQTTKMLIDALPEETLLYPGHDYRRRNLEFAHMVEPENEAVRAELGSLKDVNTHDLGPVSLAQERKVNPFLRLDSSELRHHLRIQNDEREIFYKLRSLRDSW